MISWRRTYEPGAKVAGIVISHFPPAAIKSSEAQLPGAVLPSLRPASPILKKDRSPGEALVQSSPAHFAR